MLCLGNLRKEQEGRVSQYYYVAMWFITLLLITHDYTQSNSKTSYKKDKDIEENQSNGYNSLFNQVETLWFLL